MRDFINKKRMVNVHLNDRRAMHAILAYLRGGEFNFDFSFIKEAMRRKFNLRNSITCTSVILVSKSDFMLSV